MHTSLLTSRTMNDPATSGPHFKHAVLQLGAMQTVVATRAIQSSQGVTLLDVGAAIHPGLRESLMQHTVADPIEEMLACTTTVDGASLRDTAQQILDDVPFFGRMAPDDKARSQLLDTLEQLRLPAPISFHLTVAHDVHHEVYLHLVRTALTAAWLARTPALPRCDPALAALAGLLHDLGMLHIDPQILDPDVALSADLRRQLYAHPQLAATLLQRQNGMPPAVVRAVAEHQECLDGSGYPRNLAADAISPMGKILSLAQVVAAMFAPGRSSPEMRLSVLLRMTWHRYDNAMAMQVLALLKPHLDVMSAELQLLDDPITHLGTIDGLLRQWPMAIAPPPAPARVETLATLAGYAAQIRRVLAGVGAVPDQLALLGRDSLDNTLLGELTLLTREACWQLSALARQARRRWQPAADEPFPPVLQQWLDSVDQLVAAITGVAPQ